MTEDRLSPILLDWLHADGADVRAFLEECLPALAATGSFSRRASATWPAAARVQVTARRTGFGVGLSARWARSDGTAYLEHDDLSARLLLPHRLPALVEQGAVGLGLLQVVQLPFGSKRRYTITSIGEARAATGLEVRFTARPLLIRRLGGPGGRRPARTKV